MTRDDIHDLALGAALVILGYALYKHFQSGQPLPASTANAVTDVENNYTTSGPTSPFTSLTDLLSGTVHDIGGYQGQNYLAGLEDDSFKKVGYW
jgi:hypothetical protein